jgi:uncharacterized protein (TIGR03086 family)
MDEIIDWNARAVQGSVRVVAKVRETDLSKPTPCAGWTLAHLLTHMTVQHRGFAAAARGDGADLGHWQPARVDQGSLVAEYALAADAVITAFAAESVLDRKFALPEISTQMLVPARQAIGFHLVDYVAHGWDVARSLGLGYDVDPDVLEPALAVALAVPDDDERRRRPGASFAPRLEPASDEPLDRILTLLGRDPAWPR